MKKVVFLTGTRADFGKIKSLMMGVQENEIAEVHVFVTGMHMSSTHGSTHIEVDKLGISNVFKYINHRPGDDMDAILAKSVQGFSDYVREIQPDLIVIHGDRVETLAGAIVGCINNIPVAHIEGGEVSGTVDEMIRHAVTKLSHLHFVSNESAASRLSQMGEASQYIHVIGSPDLDIMSSSSLPTLHESISRYGIRDNTYGIAMFHPVTTELSSIQRQAEVLMQALERTGLFWLVVYPNNDSGYELILDVIKKYEENARFKIVRSVRFEHFLTLLKNAKVMVGNSSAGIREAPFYGVPTVNVGSRQNGRASLASIQNIEAIDPSEIVDKIQRVIGHKYAPSKAFGDGNSTKKFCEILSQELFWNVPCQKVFIDQ